MKYADLTNKFDLFLFDMDQTLIFGHFPLPGAAELIARLRRDNKTIRFVTNNTMHPVVEHLERLHHAEIEAHEDDILTPVPGLLKYMNDAGLDHPFVIASDNVKVHFPDHGKPHDSVVLGLCRNWDYAQFQKAVNYAVDGLPFILCQPDQYCPDPNGNIPDSAAFLALIETAANRKVESMTVIGKPSASLIAPILAETGIAPARTVIFGDRLKTDMLLSDNAGIHGVCMLTGQTKRGDITPDMPYTVLDDLTALF